MFSSISIDKLKKFLFVGFVSLFLVFALGGCSTDPEDDTNYEFSFPVNLLGEWDSGYGDSYTITLTGDTINLEYSAEGSYEYDGVTYDYDNGLAGTVEFFSYHNNTGTAGIIIVELSSSGTDNYKDIEGYPYTGIYFRNFTKTSVDLGNVINLTDYSSADTADLEEAIEKFTRSKTGIYMWSYGTYNKQQ